MDQSDNPFAAPLTNSPAMLSEGAFVGQSSDAEAMRRKYLKHEASIRSIGILYYLGAFFMGIIAAGILVTSLAWQGSSMPGPAELGFVIGMGVAYGLLAVISFLLARGLRALKTGVRIPVGIFAALGLLSFPIGTLINAYILYLVFSAKGKVVFSPEYREVIRRTPHIKYKTSLLAWIVLIVVLLLAAAGIATFVLSG